MTIATTPGYPRIGPNRELKRALEGFWAGKRSAAELDETAASLRRDAWERQARLGLTLLPVNDFSLYDQMLDMAIVLGAIPARFGWDGGPVGHDLRFAMARGRIDDDTVGALELTKWFDTNYHYLVPELAPDQTFRLADDKPLREYAEAKAAGHGDRSRVMLMGPLTFLLLSKRTDDGSTLELLDAILPVYEQLVGQLAEAGVPWISIDEPVLVADRTAAELDALRSIYQRLAAVKGQSKLLVQTYFGDPGEALGVIADLPIDGIGLDLGRGAGAVERIVRDGLDGSAVVFAGVVDGRNVWTNNLRRSLVVLQRLSERLGRDRVAVSSSCSLLHVPIDVRREEDLPEEIQPWLAFADQKIEEIATLRLALDKGTVAAESQVSMNALVHERARQSALRSNAAVRERISGMATGSDRRSAAFAERHVAQRERLGLPDLPTTTIGSFPQTPAIREQRRRFERGDIDAAAYDGFIAGEIEAVIRRQEAVGLDVLVHGEPERNDMVQFFGEQLDGFAFTRNGWVQSYGSRYVRPPIIFGDVARPTPMTVHWAEYAQSLTERPVKGMLTGPVTILNWSFVRDDQPRADTCLQIAFAIQDEVRDLEAAGIGVIQVDEPAIREGLPLRRAEWDAYLEWATRAFRVSTAIAGPETQIHTHMCYSEFAEIISAIEDLDADVLSIEHARSGQELLEVFRSHGYDKGIGPGVYDIHSPAIPETDRVTGRLREILDVLPIGQIWVNPDCGLKTRKDDEVWPSLEHMVAAARELRERVGTQS